MIRLKYPFFYGFPMECTAIIVKVLYSEKKTNSKAKQKIAYVVAHELAHQVNILYTEEVKTVSFTHPVVWQQKYKSSKISLTCFPHSGSATWSPWVGGTICGSTKALPRGWDTRWTAWLYGQGTQRLLYFNLLLVPLIGPFEVVEPQGVGQIQPDWAIEEFVEFDVRQSSLKVQHHQCKSIPNWEAGGRIEVLPPSVGDRQRSERDHVRVRRNQLQQGFRNRDLLTKL